MKRDDGEGPRPLLLRLAAGDATALDALAGELIPLLVAAQPALPDPRATVRRALSAAPGVVVSSWLTLRSLVEHLAANLDPALADAGPAPMAPTRAIPPLLDLDAGRTPHTTAAQEEAWVELALRLVPAALQPYLLAHRAGRPPASLAVEFGVHADVATARSKQALDLHRRILTRLLSGQAAEALASVARDPWGAPTHWSMILSAADDPDRAQRQAAWQRLVDRYRTPIREAIKRRRRADEDPDRLADEFFSYLFEQGLLQRASPERGRFRAFVQAVLKRFLLSRRRHRTPVVTLAEETMPAAEPAVADAAIADEHAWASQLLHIALARVFATSPRGGQILVSYYGIAWPDVPGSGVARTRDEIASSLGITLDALDQANRRARQQLRAAIESELAETVATPADASSELTLMVRRLLEAYPGLV